jgi:Cu2+-exporting ATPase
MAVHAPSPSIPSGCLHCGLPVDHAAQGDFCCVGCKSVHGLLHREHLDRYYALRGGRGVPVAEARAERRDSKWLEVLQAGLRASEGRHGRLILDVQGLHCVGCVWLIEELFARAGGGGRIVVNPALGRVDLLVERSFELAGFVSTVERHGYLFGPAIKRAPAASGDLLWRLGVCAAIAMNSMIFGIAIYAGLDRGPIFDLFTTLNFGLGAAAVAVGGSVFLRSAATAVRRGLMHLDLPIAVGIVLAFAGSAYSYFAHRSRTAYFDTLDVFIALMLFGRWLQERVLERNRAWLLASDGTDGLLARRIEDGHVRLVRAAEVGDGDTLLIAPGDLVPVDARLQRARASFSLDWVNGESEPRTYEREDIVPAGAFAAGNEAAVVRAIAPFEASTLGALLRQPRQAPDAARSTAWWQRLARWYVASVLAVAAAGFAAWWGVTGDVSRALSVTTAVLIVTCPCAFGIATPLAYELVQAGLRRRGLFVRRASFLDRARDVKRVVFDKTGTLTTGALVLSNPEAVDALEERAKGALYDLVARSSHPKSAAIRASLDAHPLSVHQDARVVEYAGSGLEWTDGTRRWRLGQPAWACASAGTDPQFDMAFALDGHLLARLRTRESLRPDAAREVRALADDGLEIWLLSGDVQGRVESAGRVSGIALQRCLGDQSPQDKARFLERHDRADTMFVGDGVNDALALDRAYVSGTPAVDRPFVPSRSDFFFLTPGLAPIRLALRSARALAQVVRMDLSIALAYNAGTVALALAGRMSPLACAVLMPLSSLTTIAATVVALSPRSSLWKS